MISLRFQPASAFVNTSDDQIILCSTDCRWFFERSLKKNLNAPRPSEHSPVRGENVETFRWDDRLQIKNLFMALNGFPDGSNIGLTV